MDVQCADGLEAHACPPGFKRPGTHVICTGHYGRGKQERVFQRDPAQFTLQTGCIGRQVCLTFGTDLVIQPVHQVPDRDLTRSHTGMFAWRAAGQAWVLIRDPLRCTLFIPEPDIAQELCRLQFTTGQIAGRLGTKSAVYHIRSPDHGLTVDHRILSSHNHGLRFCIRDAGCIDLQWLKGHICLHIRLYCAQPDS